MGTTLKTPFQSISSPSLPSPLGNTSRYLNENFADCSDVHVPLDAGSTAIVVHAPLDAGSTTIVVYVPLDAGSTAIVVHLPLGAGSTAFDVHVPLEAG